VDSRSITLCLFAESGRAVERNLHRSRISVEENPQRKQRSIASCGCTEKSQQATRGWGKGGLWRDSKRRTKKAPHGKIVKKMSVKTILPCYEGRGGGGEKGDLKNQGYAPFLPTRGNKRGPKKKKLFSKPEKILKEAMGENSADPHPVKGKV